MSWARQAAAALLLSSAIATLASAQSIGSPSGGRLQRGVPLPLQGTGFRFNPRRDARARFASGQVIAALMEAAAAMPQGPELIVNDLSAEAGGPLPQHGSHQNGRDVDVLFALRDAKGEALTPMAVPLDPRGKGWDFGDLADPRDDRQVQLDAPRTWHFIAALLGQRQASLQRVFVVEHLRTLLLREAQRQGAPVAMVERFADLSCQPASPHDDHMHLRFFCSAEDIDAGCLDLPPMYPWQRRALTQLGRTPVMARATKERSGHITTSRSEAAKRAGPMHPRVRAWLKQRERWAQQPHPGRPYCR